MKIFYFQLLLLTVFLACVCGSGCSPEDTSKNEQGYKIGSQVSGTYHLHTDLYFSFSGKKILVTHHPDKGVYERANDGTFYIVCDDAGDKEIHDLRKYRGYQLRKAELFVIHFVIKQKTLNVYPERDVYHVDIIGGINLTTSHPIR